MLAPGMVRIDADPKRTDPQIITKPFTTSGDLNAEHRELPPALGLMGRRDVSES